MVEPVIIDGDSFKVGSTGGSVNALLQEALRRGGDPIPQGYAHIPNQDMVWLLARLLQHALGTRAAEVGKVGA